MFRVPEKYRITEYSTLSSNAKDGNNGGFKIPLSHRSIAYAIASDGMGWEHVSVHVVMNKKERIPTWAEMCKIKNLFWDKEDCVVQFHPSETEYVNTHEYTLHLWRSITQDFPIPKKIMV